MSADNVSNLEIVRKMNKYEILRTISQQRTLSADIPASQKGVYSFYNPAINFHIV